MAREATLVQRGLWLEYLTIGWSVVSAVGALLAGLIATSVALVGFGLDSVVEAFTGIVVVWQLRGIHDKREQQALRLIGIAFLVLAAYIGFQAISSLLSDARAQPSPAGIVITTAAMVIMTLLAMSKRQTGSRLGNAVLLTEATVTFIDAGLAAGLLLGLLLNALLGWWWADPLVALGLAGLAIKEGLEALRDAQAKPA